MPGTLICYGDSNTYGYDPHDTNEGRYPKEVRWTGILDTETDWKVENHGVNGRSIPHTVSTVKFACQQVRDWHRKPNSVWLLVMLGTNDLLENPDFTASGCGKEDGTLSETNDGRSRTCKQKDAPSSDRTAGNAGRTVGGPSGTSDGIPQSGKRI